MTGNRLLVAFSFCLITASALPDDSVEVVASSAGFRPSVIKARKGEPLHLTLRSADSEHCFAVDALRIEKRIRPGRPASIDITADRTGRFDFYCCLDPERERGELVVTE